MPTDYNKFIADTSAYLAAAKAALSALDGVQEQDHREVLALISDIESKIKILRLATTMIQVVSMHIEILRAFSVLDDRLGNLGLNIGLLDLIFSNK